MCSISGIYAPRGLSQTDRDSLGGMNGSLKHRGPDASDLYIEDRVALCHNRLAVVDPTGGAQPMQRKWKGRTYTIVYNGEIYNTDEVKGELTREGVTFSTHSDTEAVLYAYAVWGEDCPLHLNGIFAFAVWDGQRLFCARDRMGVKPFFFARVGDTFLFASEIKSLLSHSGVAPVLDARGVWELLYLSPTILPGSGIFRDIQSLLPAERMTVDEGGLCRSVYWQVEAAPFTDSRDDAVDHVRYLLTDAIRRQLVSDVPLCTFLSGGLDSSIVSAVAAESYRRQGRRLATYSFEYEDNDYAPTLFQPNRDDEYAVRMAKEIGSRHRVLVAPTEAVAEELLPAMLSRDYPGQADIDSSLRYFCGEVRREHTVALSGECADEIFGGYPWFYRPEMTGRDFFPWIHDPTARMGLFDPRKVRAEEGYHYLKGVYRRTVDATSVLEGEGEDDRRARIGTKLSVDYFMASLLERKDRMSMAHGLEVRVPFSDHRILEYVYNVPWHIKFEGGVEKALLRNAMASYLPDFVLNRKKSPYPKTHNPAYEETVRKKLLSRLARDHSPLGDLLQKDAIRSLTEGANLTWLGQLMARPQLYAWLYQLDTWLEHYRVQIAL